MLAEPVEEGAGGEGDDDQQIVLELEPHVEVREQSLLYIEEFQVGNEYIVLLFNRTSRYIMWDRCDFRCPCTFCC